MRRRYRLLWGMGLGVLASAGIFVADLAAAACTIGGLFDPTVDSVALLGVALVLQLAVGALVGLAAGLLWRSRWRLGRRLGFGVLFAVMAAVFVVAYVGRQGRQHVEPATVTMPAGALEKHRQSVLWVVVDTLRADTFYGDTKEPDFPLAPATASWAKDALVFTDVEAASGWTIPSMATLLTGIHPTALGADRKLLPDWAPTMAERLWAAGYETRGLVDNTILEPRNGFSAGFITYWQQSGLRFAFSLPSFRLLPSMWRRYAREALRVAYAGCDVVNARATEVLAEARTRPLFLYVHYMDPHAPYYPQPELGEAPPGTMPITRTELLAREGPQRFASLRAEELAFLEHRYANEVRAVDACFGELLRQWHASMGEQGVVLLTADHGEEFMDHQEVGHGHSLYRELVQVPLVLQLPAAVLAKRARRVNAPVGHVDVVPTVLEALDIPLELGAGGVSVQGVSWLPWLRGRAEAPSRPLYAAQNSKGRRIARWRQGKWALIRTRRGNGPELAELFDKERDSAEAADLFEGAVETAKILGSELDAFRQQQQRGWPLDAGKAEPNIEGMRALGYVQ